MIFIYGTDVKPNKKVSIALQSIVGIGSKFSEEICNLAGIGKNIRVSDLSEAQISSMDTIIEKSKKPIGSDLKKEQFNNIARLIRIGCYRGIRHDAGLPLRGQRTHSNGRTQKKLSKLYRNRVN
jgi:small subunit ribosomal protein S13